jgi:hypothetical protein
MVDLGAGRLYLRKYLDGCGLSEKERATWKRPS